MDSSRPKLIGGRRWAYPSQGLALVLLALVIYRPSFHSQFTIDDLSSIVQDRYVQISDLKPRTLAKAAFKNFKQNRPLTNITLALNYYFNGLNPFGYHIVNFGFFLATAFGIWLLLLKLFSRLGLQYSRAGLAAWLSALVWTAHPLNTQAVTYIIQRHTSMAGAFSIWSIYFYHLGREKRRFARTFFSLSAFFCLCALLNKESALTLPAIIFAYKLYFFDEFKPGWLGKSWKWILALAVFYAAALAIMLRPEMMKILFDFSRYPFGPREKSLTEFRVLIWYSLLVLFPFPQYLSAFHDFSPSPSIFHPITTFFAMLTIVSLLFLAAVKARTWRIFSFTLLWYFLALLVEALPVAIHLAVEHRLYLASLSIIAPATAILVFKSRDRRKAAAGIFLITAFFGFFTWSRNLIWNNEESILRDAIDKNPSSFDSWYPYCTKLAEKDKCGRAIPVCRKAVELDPSVYKGHNNLGLCYLKEGKLNLAQKELAAAAALSPADEDSGYYNLGQLFLRKKDYKNAAAAYQAALQRNPANLGAHYNLAFCRLYLGDKPGYFRELSEALRLRPDWIEVRLLLASEMAKAGQCPKALDLVNSAPVPHPGFGEIKANCANQPEPPGK